MITYFSLSPGGRTSEVYEVVAQPFAKAQLRLACYSTPTQERAS